MHGELAKARCLGCGAVGPSPPRLAPSPPCPSCGKRGGLRPHVVWFGEMPMGMERIEAALRRCGVFVSVGTSGSVYPAAGFVAEARGHGARTVELNLEPSEGSALFDEARHGPATRLVPAFVDALLLTRCRKAPRVTRRRLRLRSSRCSSPRWRRRPTAPPAAAQDGGPSARRAAAGHRRRRDPRRPVDARAEPWRALGRVQLEVGGRCTGVLVGPRTVLTAAHCLFGPRSRQVVRPGTVHFLLGYHLGEWTARARVSAFATGRGLRRERDGPRIGPLGADWALLTLDAPLGEGRALRLRRDAARRRAPR